MLNKVIFVGFWGGYRQPGFAPANKPRSFMQSVKRSLHKRGLSCSLRHIGDWSQSH